MMKVKKMYNGGTYKMFTYKGFNYMRSYFMRGIGVSHGYDYFLIEADGNQRYFPTYAKLKEYINACVEVEKAQKRLMALCV